MRATMHSVTDRETDRQTDGRQEDAHSRSYCVSVRSAKNSSIVVNKNTSIVTTVTLYVHTLYVLCWVVIN